MVRYFKYVAAATRKPVILRICPIQCLATQGIILLEKLNYWCMLLNVSRTISRSPIARGDFIIRADGQPDFGLTRAKNIRSYGPCNIIRRHQVIVPQVRQRQYVCAVLEIAQGRDRSYGPKHRKPGERGTGQLRRAEPVAWWGFVGT
jgi:hypothetical protein